MIKKARTLVLLYVLLVVLALFAMITPSVIVSKIALMCCPVIIFVMLFCSKIKK